MPKRITIIGGGLAGLTLGIGLRRRGIPVTVIEASHYPRHRVCGEFISGCGQRTLANLGLLEPLSQAGTVNAGTAAFFLSGHTNPPIRRLEQEALCISRFRLDSFLAETFRRAGGELQENTQADVAAVEEGTVRASGRRRQPLENGYAWFGVKIHARNLPLVADLEMHAFENGYVGLCRLPDNEVNICGLFRRDSRAHNAECRTQHETKTALARFVANVPAGSPLHNRLAPANTDESSFCSVAGLSLKPHRAAELPDCSLGDSLTMTPPVTGNGMSMAFESAELSIEPLCAYARGEVSWQDARREIARACDERFACRLRWAQWLQWMMFSALFQNSLGCVAVRSQLIWNLLFRRTRTA
jgi:2-polyprenyl-6-methoxyphenol hydroxylase-like FAD-dependent oxidoreductase